MSLSTVPLTGRSNGFINPSRGAGVDVNLKKKYFERCIRRCWMSMIRLNHSGVGVCINVSDTLENVAIWIYHGLVLHLITNFKVLGY